MKLAFDRIAHQPGYENACLFKAADNPLWLVVPCYSNAALTEFVTTHAESTLNFVRTHSAEDFIECALQLKHVLTTNSSVMLLVASDAERDDLSNRLVAAGAIPSQDWTATKLLTLSDASIFIDVWGAQNSVPFTNLLAISPMLSQHHDLIMQRDSSFGIDRRYILFHNRELELNVS